MQEKPKLLKYRIHLIYKADGMTRPLSSRQTVPAYTVSEAVQLATHFIKSAYVSGFEVLTWSAENLSLPVEVKYVRQVEKVGDGGIIPGSDDGRDHAH